MKFLNNHNWPINDSNFKTTEPSHFYFKRHYGPKNNLKLNLKPSFKMKFFLILLNIILINSCIEKPSNKCRNSRVGKAVLVAYKVKKHSVFWLRDPQTKIIHEITGLGSHKKPIINLNDTIDVYYCDGQIKVNKEKLIKRVNDYGFYSLKGYKKLNY